jgi:hypothetical protein
MATAAERSVDCIRLRTHLSPMALDCHRPATVAVQPRQAAPSTAP